MKGIHLNVLSFHSKNGNGRAIQRRQRKEAPPKAGGGRQHHQKEAEIAAIGRRHHWPTERVEGEVHLSFLVLFSLSPFGWC